MGLSDGSRGLAQDARHRDREETAHRENRERGAECLRGVHANAVRHAALPDQIQQQADERLQQRAAQHPRGVRETRSEEHTSELQSLMRISYAVFCLKKKTNTNATE